MDTDVVVDGITYSLQKQPGGIIRVTQGAAQVNPLQGAGTLGRQWHDVHPCQRNQYEFWNAKLPPDQRATVHEMQATPAPWWSSGTGEAASIKE